MQIVIYLFIYGIEIDKFKAKGSKINSALLYLGSEHFSTNNMKKTGLYGYVYDFSIDFDSIEVDDILDIHKYLIKKLNKE